MPELGSYYISIIPTLKGASQQINAQLSGVDTSKSGALMGSKMSKGIVKGLSFEAVGAKISNFGGQLDNAGSALTSKITKPFMVGAAAAAGAAVGIGSAALGAYATWEQAVGGVDTLFKGASKTVQKYADEAYKTAGLSANDYMSTVTSFSASLIQSLGGNTKEAAEIGNRAVIDMSDNANKMGTSMTDIQNAYQGFAKQNYTMLDNLKLGYGGTQAEMQRLLEDATALSGIEYNIDSFADVVEAIHVVQDELGITGTTALEAAETIEGSVATMKGAWANWLTEIGKTDGDVQGATQKLTDSIVTVFENVAPRIGEIFRGIVAAIPELWAGLKAQLPATFDPLVQKIEAVVKWFTNLDDSTKKTLAVFAGGVVVLGPILSILGKILGPIGSLIGFLGKLGPIFRVVTTAAKLLWVVLAANPIGAIITAIVAVIGALTWFFTSTDTGKAIWQGFMDWLGQAWETIKTVAVTVWTAVSDFFSQIWNGIKATFETVWGAVQAAMTVAWENAKTVFEAAWNHIKIIFETVWNHIKIVFETVWNHIKIVVETVMGVIEGIIAAVTAAIQGDWSGAWEAIKGVAATIWNGIKAVVQNAINGVKAVISNVLGGIKGVWSNAWNAVKSVFTNIWNGIKGGASDGINAVFRVVTGIKDKILGFFSGAGSWLVNAGKNILQGFLNGLKSAFEGVKNFVGGIGSWIAAHKGPKAYDLALLVPAGRWIMQGLDEGLTGGFRAVKASVSSFGPGLEDSFSATLNGGFSSVSGGAALAGAPVGAQVVYNDNRTVNNPVAEPDSIRVQKNLQRAAANVGGLG